MSCDGIAVSVDGDAILIVATAGGRSIRVRVTSQYARTLAARLLLATHAVDSLPPESARQVIARRLRESLLLGRIKGTKH